MNDTKKNGWFHLWVQDQFTEVTNRLDEIKSRMDSCNSSASKEGRKQGIIYGVSVSLIVTIVMQFIINAI